MARREELWIGNAIMMGGVVKKQIVGGDKRRELGRFLLLLL